MSAQSEITTSGTGAAPSPAPRLNLVTGAGLAACGALAAALFVGGGGSVAPAAGLGAIAIAMLLAAAVQQLLTIVRTKRVRTTLGTTAVVAVVLFALAWIAVFIGRREAFIAATFVVGLILVGEWLVGSFERLERRATPWEGLGGRRSPGRALWRTARLIAGVIALLWGFANTVGWLGDFVPTVNGRAYGFVQLQVLVVIGIAAMALIIPVFLLERARTQRAQVLHQRALDRQAISAHLHDSVLQTLAMIQRKAEDPRAVVHLARQQERSLRAWLAGRDEEEQSSLAAALRAVCGEVEGEFPGALIDCITAGDAPFDARTDALARATREALRNAMDHAPGSDVRVFLEAEPELTTVYVRDTGPGFDLTVVPEERRGVRDAILGRMAHVGGTAEIDSGPGGTEVVLRLPVLGRRERGGVA